mgnify:CR=1 FL=1
MMEDKFVEQQGTYMLSHSVGLPLKTAKSATDIGFWHPWSKGGENVTLSRINQEVFWMSRSFWTLLLLPIFLLLTAYLIKLFVFDKTKDASSVKQRRAQQLAKKYLSSAKRIPRSSPIL